MKTCAKCQEIKPLDAFEKEPRAKDGRRYSCKACRNAQRRALALTRGARPLSTRAKQTAKDYGRRYRQKFVWRTLLLHARKRAAKFGWAFDLDEHAEAMRTRVEKMTCEMTGLPLVSSAGVGSPGQRRWNTPSLDRIDPTKGYTYQNTRIVCWAMNAAMSTWGEEVTRTVMKAWMRNG